MLQVYCGTDNIKRDRGCLVHLLFIYYFIKKWKYFFIK